MLRPLSIIRAYTYTATFQQRSSRQQLSKCCARRRISCTVSLRNSSVETSCNILKDIQQYTAKYPVSIFESTSNNPYHNLAIENYILRNSEPNSSILLTYVNRPCIVFGRNQNPWLEINIARATQGLPWNAADWQDYETAYIPEEGEAISVEHGKDIPLDLVRRRSGGGTVIHDAGNLNFSFIIPNDKDFTRNKHARLIVQALQSYLRQSGSQSAYFGKDDIYVNERHDIAMRLDGRALKVSGSAFKLTKGRALHHGTLLLASPNIPSTHDEKFKQGQSIFSQLLSSPAKPFLDAKGVGSVSSPVHNLFDVQRTSANGDNSIERRRLISEVKAAIAEEFRFSHHDSDVADTVTVGDEAVRGGSKIGAICKDVEEMVTDAWRYGQTPSFSYKFSREHTTISFQAKQSNVSEARLDASKLSEDDTEMFSTINGKLLHEIESWDDYVPREIPDRASILENLSSTFPNLRSSRATETNGRIIDDITEESIKNPRRVVRHISGHSKIEIEEGDRNTVVQK